MTVPSFADIIFRLIDSGQQVRDTAQNLPPYIREQFEAAAPFMTDEELAFALGYTDYYMVTRGSKIIRDQFFWSTKYAFTIAPLMAALFPGRVFAAKYVGDMVDYSFSSIRDSSMPDPAGYDPNLIYGAVILRINRCYSTLHARTIGESWGLVVNHWGQLEGKDAEYMVEFIGNLSSGGSVPLAEGLL